MKINIRQENPSDYDEVYDLVKLAFLTAEQSDENEHDLVNKLRASSSFVPELSLIAEYDKQIIGHILFTKAYVGDNLVLALAPLSVHPKFQNQGIASKLIKEGHLVAKELGFTHSIVLGSDEFYSKFSYKPCEEFGINNLEGIDPKYFMAYALSNKNINLKGDMIYSEEFGM